jgi:hypothetical protein
MLSPECLQFSLGPPVISADALLELHDLLSSLLIPTDCDKASPNSSSKEGADDSFSDQRAFQFRHCTEDREYHSSRGCGGVQGLRETDELEGAEQVGHAARETIEFPNRHYIKAPPVTVRYQTIQFRPAILSHR